MPPIALKVGTLGLTEKFVRFQDESFWQSLTDKFTALVDKNHHLMKTSVSFREETLNSTELSEVIRVYERFFWWRTGKYHVHFLASSQNDAKVVQRKYHFSLSDGDVEMLRANLDVVKTDFENRIMVGKEHYEEKPIAWNWRNPRLTAAG